MDTIERLISGYKDFFQQYFAGNDPTYKTLAEGQSPKALIIACSDSRVDPSVITRSTPGEIFVIRNVANLVPPYQPFDKAYHGTSAAIEFAVRNLNVRHIVLLGHSRCAGIRALIQGHESGGEYSFIDPWMDIAKDAKEVVYREHGHRSIDEQARICEEEALKISLQNLLTFPYVVDKVEKGELRLHAWHFDVVSGALYQYRKEDTTFAPIPIDAR